MRSELNLAPKTPNGNWIKGMACVLVLSGVLWGIQESTRDAADLSEERSELISRRTDNIPAKILTRLNYSTPFLLYAFLAWLAFLIERQIGATNDLRLTIEAEFYRRDKLKSD